MSIKGLKSKNWGRGGEQAGQEVRMDHPGVGCCNNMDRGSRKRLDYDDGELKL